MPSADGDRTENGSEPFEARPTEARPPGLDLRDRARPTMDRLRPAEQASMATRILTWIVAPFVALYLFLGWLIPASLRLIRRIVIAAWAGTKRVAVVVASATADLAQALLRALRWSWLHFVLWIEIVAGQIARAVRWTADRVAPLVRAVAIVARRFLAAVGNAGFAVGRALVRVLHAVAQGARALGRALLRAARVVGRVLARAMSGLRTVLVGTVRLMARGVNRVARALAPLWAAARRVAGTAVHWLAFALGAGARAARSLVSRLADRFDALAYDLASLLALAFRALQAAWDVAGVSVRWTAAALAPWVRRAAQAVFGAVSAAATAIARLVRAGFRLTASVVRVAGIALSRALRAAARTARIGFATLRRMVAAAIHAWVMPALRGAARGIRLLAVAVFIVPARAAARFLRPWIAAIGIGLRDAGRRLIEASRRAASAIRAGVRRSAVAIRDSAGRAAATIRSTVSRVARDVRDAMRRASENVRSAVRDVRRSIRATIEGVRAGIRGRPVGAEEPRGPGTPSETAQDGSAAVAPPVPELPPVTLMDTAASEPSLQPVAKGTAPTADRAPIPDEALAPGAAGRPARRRASRARAAARSQAPGPADVSQAAGRISG